MARRSTNTAASCLLLVLVAGSPAAAQLVQAGDLVLQSSEKTSFLQRADGSRLELPLSASATVTSLAAVTGEDGKHVFAAAVDGTGADRRLLLLRGTEELAAPEVREGLELREPALLVDESGLRALAWFEGPAPRRQTLRVARRIADGWQVPETVSPHGAGSQMALTTAYAGQGVWMLAWAAYDGNDDEILWSRFSLEEGATPPERLAEDNEVPDIVPSLVATADGVLAAWNRYDGSGYELVLARYDGRSWSVPSAVAPRGSLYPTLHATGRGTLLLYQRAVPSAWAVAELDRSGNVTRTASFETHRAERPALYASAAGDVTLLWVAADVEDNLATRLRFSAPVR